MSRRGFSKNIRPDFHHSEWRGAAMEQDFFGFVATAGTCFMNILPYAISAADMILNDDDIFVKPRLHSINERKMIDEMALSAR